MADEHYTSLENKYENIIRIADIETKKIATVSIVIKYFPTQLTQLDIKELLTVFISTFTEALLISQRNKVNKFDVLVDCEGSSTKNVNYDFGKNLITLTKHTFNDNLGRCVIFNTNSAVRTVYKIVKPLIDKDTRQKIKVF